MNEEGKNETLHEYLKENQDILTALGVFVAITMLAGNLSIKLISLFISFASFSCTTFIILEIWRKSSGKHPSLLLNFFKWALSILATSYLLYWFVIFDLMMPGGVGIIFAILIAAGVAWFFKKINWRPPKWGGVVIAITIIAISFFLGYLIKTPVYEFSASIVTVSSKLQGAVQ